MYLWSPVGWGNLCAEVYGGVGVGICYVRSGWVSVTRGGGWCICAIVVTERGGCI